MLAKEAIDIAIKWADIYVKIAQFFIIVSTAIAGWFVTLDIMGTTDALDIRRISWVLLYTIASFMFWIGLVVVIIRINASFSLARKLAKAERIDYEEFAKLAASVTPRLTMYLIPVVVVGIDIFMLFLTKDGLEKLLEYF